MSTTKARNETKFTTPSDREIQITRTFNAPRALVWEAWTNPEHVKKWMLGPDGWSLTIREQDARTGGHWHYIWTKATGEEMEMRGKYVEVVPIEKIVHSEQWGEEWAETVNTLIMTESNGQTTVVETMLYPNKDARDAALATGMKEGMTATHDRLEKLLANGQL